MLLWMEYHLIPLFFFVNFTGDRDVFTNSVFRFEVL